MLHSLPAFGWTTNDGTRWTYAGAAGAIISKAKLSLKNGEFLLRVRGKAGRFLVNTAVPQLDVVFGGDAGATVGQCVSRSFGEGAVPACEISDKKLKCG